MGTNPASGTRLHYEWVGYAAVATTVWGFFVARPLSADPIQTGIRDRIS